MEQIYLTGVAGAILAVLGQPLSPGVGTQRSIKSLDPDWPLWIGFINLRSEFKLSAFAVAPSE